ncbi:MAG TPA: TIGR00730 family Rossman fold protein [Patescibacteria group bacterium]|nr:TIGR00730 family Rossman fold protein [Patescibacteria group bacterium]
MAINQNKDSIKFHEHQDHFDLPDDHHMAESEVICFTSGGREICVRAGDLPKLFKGKSREVSSWTIMKIQAEFVKGFDFLKRYKKAASIYGSARGSLGNGVYEEARKLAFNLANSGFAIITGGGPGIMEAANKGAFEAGGRSVGINIKLPTEQRTNTYVKESAGFDFFFTRKVMLETASSLYIFFPGGYGTMDEFFEMITLIQTHKIPKIPIILVNKAFWQPLVDWLKVTVMQENGAISQAEYNLFTLVNNADEAWEYIKKLPKEKHLFD